MGLGYEHKPNNINLIVNRSHKQTVKRAVHDQRVGKCPAQQHFVAEQGYFCCVLSKQDAQQAELNFGCVDWQVKINIAGRTNVEKIRDSLDLRNHMLKSMLDIQVIGRMTAVSIALKRHSSDIPGAKELFQSCSV